MKKKENKAVNLGLLWISEFLATGILLLLGCGGCITAHLDVKVAHYGSAMNFGMAVLVSLQLFGHISGSHINPQVTLASYILGYTDNIKALVYVSAQFLGAVLGLGLVKILTPHEYIRQDVYDAASNTTKWGVGLCTSMPNPNITTIQAVAIEAIITAILIWLCCALWDKRNSTKVDSIPIRFGLVVACIAIAFGPYTSASMNTARSFAPALLNQNWQKHWIYWLGPTLGSVIAAFAYKFMYNTRTEEDKGEEEGTPLSVISKT